MRYYETMYIVNPNYEEDRLKKVIENINDELRKYKVKVINHYLWGKKKLAYPIQKHKYGNYVIIHFENNEIKYLLDFEMFLRLDSSVLRFQTVRLELEPDVVEQHEIISEDEEKESSLKQTELTKENNSDSSVEKEDQNEGEKPQELDDIVEDNKSEKTEE